MGEMEEPTAEPNVMGMTRSLGEIVYRLRRRDDELRALIAEISDEYRAYDSIRSNLMNEEHVTFDAELPPFLLETMARYETFMGPQTKMYADPGLGGSASFPR